MKTTLRCIICGGLLLFLASPVYGHWGPLGGGYYSDPISNKALVDFYIDTATTWANDGYWRAALWELEWTPRIINELIWETDPKPGFEKWQAVGREYAKVVERKRIDFLEVSNRVESARQQRRAKEFERLARARKEISNPKTPLERATVTDFAGDFISMLKRARGGWKIERLDGSVQNPNDLHQLTLDRYLPIDHNFFAGTLYDVENGIFPSPTIPRGEHYRCSFKTGDSDTDVEIVHIFISSEELNDAYLYSPETDENGELVSFKPGYPTARFSGLGIMIHQRYCELPVFVRPKMGWTPPE